MKMLKFLLPALLLAGFALAAAEDPWVLWKRADEMQKLAARQRDKGDAAEALRLYRSARDNYLQVKTDRPDWNIILLDERIGQCDLALTELEKVAGAATAAAAATDDPATAAEVARLRDALNTANEKLFAAMLERDDALRDLKSAQTAASEVESLIREKQLLQEEIAIRDKELETLRTRLASPDGERETLRQQLLELQVGYDLLERRYGILDGQIAALESERAEAYRARNQARTEAKILAERVLTLENDLERQRLDLRRGRDAAERAAAETADALKETERLRAELKLRQEEYSAVLRGHVENASADQAVRELFDANQALQKKYDELQNDYAVLNADFRGTRDRMRDLQLETTRTGDLLQRLDSDAKRLKADYDDLQERFDQQGRALELSSVSEKQATERAANLDAQLSGVRDEHAATLRRLEAREAGDLESARVRTGEIQTLRDRLAEVERDNATLTARHDAAKQSHADLEERFARARQDFIDLKARAMSLELELRDRAEAPDRVAELETSLADAEARHAAEVAELRSEAAAREAVIAELEKRPATAPVQPQTQPLQPPETVATTPPARSLSDADIERGLASARDALANRTPELAVWEYQRILRHLPENFDANQGLGRLYIDENRIREAAPYIRKAYKQRPADPATAALYGRFLAADGDPGQALSLLDQALAEHPGNFDLELALARVGAVARDWERALEHYGRILNSEYNTPELQLELVRVLLALDRNDEAARLYENARNAGARPDPVIENALGTLLSTNRELARFLKQAGDEALTKNDYDSAAWYYEQLADSEPRLEAHQVQLAYIQLRRGDATAAMSAVSRAAGQTANPTTEVESLRLALNAVSCLIAREPARAADLFDRIAELNSKRAYRLPERFAGLRPLALEWLDRLTGYPELEQAAIGRAREALERAIPEQ